MPLRILQRSFPLSFKSPEIRASHTCIDRLARDLLNLERLVTQLLSDDVTVVFHKIAFTFAGEANSMQTP